MGSSSSKNLGPIDPGYSTDYDKFMDMGLQNGLQIIKEYKTGLRQLWKLTLGIFCIFVAFVICTTVSCAFETSCKKDAGGFPSMAHMLDTSITQTFLVATIYSLVLVHFTEVYSIFYLVVKKAKILGWIQGGISIAIYISLFVNLVFHTWQGMAVSLIITSLWMGIVCEALRRFYKPRRRRRLWMFTVPIAASFLISSILYISFNSLTLPASGKGQWIEAASFASEILILVFFALFSFILIPHTRWVLYECVIKK